MLDDEKQPAHYRAVFKIRWCNFESNDLVINGHMLNELGLYTAVSKLDTSTSYLK